MKIGGIDPATLPNEEILVIPRGEKEVVFRAKGVVDYDEFNELCPAPKPPGKLTKHGWEPLDNDPDYKSLIAIRNNKLEAWIIITSLAPSNIEWDTVKPENPSTWTNWKQDLKNSGFNSVERQLISRLVFQANSLDEEKLKQARDHFLLGQQPVPDEFSGQTTEPENTPSGKPAPE